MFKLCFAVALVACLAVLIEGQKYSRPFQYKPTTRYPSYYQQQKQRPSYYNNKNNNNYNKYNNYQNDYWNRVRGPAFQPLGTVSDEGLAQVVVQHSDVHPDGAYEYNYETENGIRAEEHNVPKVIKSGETSGNVEGSYAYTAPDGLSVLVEYTADENGFHPKLSYGGNGAENFLNSPSPSDVVINN